MKCTKSICNRIFVYFILIIICMTLSSWAQAQKRNYAVIGLKNAEGVTAGEAEIIADRLRIELFNTGGANMMERDQMQDILSEQGFQASGACTDEACMIEIGQLLGVERLISGSIGKLGSMFLLNFRAIDVQTAKIIAVVSKDVTGGIEDVVKHLPDIASELVKTKAPGKPVETVTPEVTEPVPVPVVPKVEEVKPEVKEPEKDEEKEPEVEVVEIGKKSKNKNRAGVRLSFNYFPGDWRERHYWDDEENEYVKADYLADEEYYDSLKNADGYSNVSYGKSLMRFQLNFMIKAGPYLIFDIGPGLMLWRNTRVYSCEYWDTTAVEFITRDQDWKLLIIAPNVSAGLNFVKRFYPLKINVGFLVDINMNIVSFKQELTWSSYWMDYSHNNRDFKMNASFGPRLGLEILGGKTFGFSLDFLMRWYRLKTDLDFVKGDDQKWMWRLPIIGLGVGFNFYY